MKNDKKTCFIIKGEENKDVYNKDNIIKNRLIKEDIDDFIFSFDKGNYGRSYISER
ncbi:MAG: hypothetical protein KFW09_00315 [Oscillospiraceae bacterium]|nr:hypothetical protein [Oscillospiraceae bacterium]